MQSLFSPDSKFMHAMNILCDLLILNVLFLLSCIPVVTVGAAAAALYTCCFHLGEEKSTVRQYMVAFRENFRQGTLFWLILLLCGGCALFNTLLFHFLSGVLSWFAIPFGILFILSVLIGSCAFPLVSRFSNDLRSTLKNSLILSIGFLPRFALIALINLFPFFLLASNLYVFFQTGFIWISIYFSTAAYVNSMLLNKVFAPYLPETKQEP